MRYEFHEEFVPSSTMPAEDYRRAREFWGSLASKELVRHTRYSEKAAKIREQYFADLHALVGQETLKRYLRLHKRRIRNMRCARKTSSLSYPELIRLDEMRRDNVEASRKLIERSGVDTRKVLALQKKRMTRQRRAFMKTISPVDTVEQAPIRGRQSPHTVVLTRPFEYANAYVFKDHSDEASIPEAEALADRTFGDCTGVSSIRVLDADDADWAYVNTYSSLSDRGVLPADGDVLVSANFQTYQQLNSWFNGEVKRECGFVQDMELEADARIQVFFWNMTKGHFEKKTTRLTSGGQTPDALEFDYPGDFAYGRGSWNVNWWDQWQTVNSIELPFGGPNEAGDQVSISITLCTHNWFDSDDFMVKSFLRHLYRLLEIRLRQF